MLGRLARTHKSFARGKGLHAQPLAEGLDLLLVQLGADLVQLGEVGV